MRKYHHLGIPTTEKREGEVHLKHLKIYVCGYKESLYHIEWMRHRMRPIQSSSRPCLM